MQERWAEAGDVGRMFDPCRFPLAFGTCAVGGTFNFQTWLKRTWPIGIRQTHILGTTTL